MKDDELKAMLPMHPFVLILDAESIQGHIFGDLKMKHGDQWITVERRCRLCNRLPLELLTVNGEIPRCFGVQA